MGSESSRPVLEPNRKSLSIKNKGLKKIPYKIPSSHHIESIEISNNRINVLPKNLKYLRNLDISYNKISEFENSPLEQSLISYQNLVELNIKGNDIKELPKSLNELINLKVLSASCNKIQNFNLKLPKLLSLDLSNNKITDFSNKVMDKLLFLNLGFNRIKKVDVSSFPKIRQLILSGNDLTKFNSKNVILEDLAVLNLAYNLIKNMQGMNLWAPKLEKLNMSFNKLTTIPSDLPKTLNGADFSFNSINEVDDNIKSLRVLTLLFLNNNYIKNVPKFPQGIDAFRLENNQIEKIHPISSSMVHTLQINNNVLQELPDFSKSTISILNVSKNNIGKIDVNFFSKCLVRCDLSFNSLTQLPNDLFKEIPQLKYLILVGNQIHSLPESISKSELLYLNISENPISKISPLPNSLTHLIASNCKFSHIPKYIDKLKNMQLINFSFNSISKISVKLSSKIICFSGNKIKEIPQMSEDISIADFSSNQISQFIVDKEYPNLTILNLSCNLISNIDFIQECSRSDQITFDQPFQYGPQFYGKHKSYFPELKKINLSRNPIKLDNLTQLLQCHPLLEFLDLFGIEILPNHESHAISKNLKEIIVSNTTNIPSEIHSNLINSFSPLSNVGYSSIQGFRASMEDNLLIKDKGNFYLFAILDGHGGRASSSLVRNYLPTLINEFSEDNIEKAIREANIYLEHNKVNDGTTLCLVAISSDFSKVMCANVGDTRSVLVKKDGSVIPLSLDHKPDNRPELELIRANGSFVSDGRCQGVLAMSRSLGDFSINGITAVPSFIMHDIDLETDSKIVIACDGLFDVLDNEEVGKIIESVNDPFDASLLLLNIAYSRGSQDNISTIVINLENR